MLDLPNHLPCASPTAAYTHTPTRPHTRSFGSRAALLDITNMVASVLSGGQGWREA